MPFDKLDKFATFDEYLKTLKTELGQMTEGERSDFWYFDGVAIEGKERALVVTGRVKPDVIKELKGKSKVQGRGGCFVQAKVLNLNLVQGKMPETKVKSLFREVKGYGAAVLNGEAQVAELADSRDTANAESRWKTTMERFDTLKGNVTDEERRDLREMWGQAEELREQKDLPALMAQLDAIDREIVRLAKLSREEAEGRAKEDRAKVEAEISDEDSKKLLAVIESQNEKLEQLKKAMDPERIAIARITEQLKQAQAALQEMQQKDDTSETALMQKKTEVTDLGKQLMAAQQRLESGQKEVDAHRQQMAMARRVLERRKARSGDATQLRLALMERQISELDKILDVQPIQLARNELKATLQRMAEATAWRKEQLKKEALGPGHATGRHGAQTGMERQARRAATSEEYVDSQGKTKARGGITPDQPDNVSGTSQSVSWNEVKVTYVEKDGRREVKDRAKVAKAIAAIPTRELGSTTGSMWATPVLEKECFDTAKKLADRLQAYTHYRRANNSWGDFKQLVVKMPPPKSTPGWGYAVQKKDNVRVSDGDAENILKEFETGKLTLDQLFEKMRVALLSEDGGAKMVRHATVVFRRSAGGDPWTLVTQYPNNDLGPADVGWAPYDNPPDTMVFKTANPTVAPVSESTKTVP